MNYSQYFETKKKHDGSDFIGCKHDAPADLLKLIENIHFNHFDKALPSDWIYQTILEAFEELEENNVLDNLTLEADIYYYDLYRWFSESFAHGLCNEVIAEFGEFKDIYQLIGAAQWKAKDIIYRAVSEFLDKKNNKGD